MPTTPLVTTAGAATANSYVSLAAANQYHVDRPIVDTSWDKADGDERTRALLHATRLLDLHVDWAGFTITTTQALLWPRAGLYHRNGIYIEDDEIPVELQNATAEFAAVILDRAKAKKGDADSQLLEKVARVARAEGIDAATLEGVTLTMGERSTEKVIPDSVIQLLPKSWFAGNSMTVELRRA